jgi:hypothetical protein
MKLRRESAENGDFSGPKGEFKKLFSGRIRAESYRDTFRSENSFLDRKSAIIGARSSRLHEICGLRALFPLTRTLLPLCTNAKLGFYAYR